MSKELSAARERIACLERHVFTLEGQLQDMKLNPSGNTDTMASALDIKSEHCAPGPTVFEGDALAADALLLRIEEMLRAVESPLLSELIDRELAKQILNVQTRVATLEALVAQQVLGGPSPAKSVDDTSSKSAAAALAIAPRSIRRSLEGQQLKEEGEIIMKQMAGVGGRESGAGVVHQESLIEEPSQTDNTSARVSLEEKSKPSPTQVASVSSSSVVVSKAPGTRVDSRTVIPSSALKPPRRASSSSSSFSTATPSASSLATNSPTSLTTSRLPSSKLQTPSRTGSNANSLLGKPASATNSTPRSSIGSITSTTPSSSRIASQRASLSERARNSLIDTGRKEEGSITAPAKDLHSSADPLMPPLTPAAAAAAQAAAMMDGDDDDDDEYY